jgi:hypothetical protein
LVCGCSMGPIGCGALLYFSWGSGRCNIYNPGRRTDSGPDCYLARNADFSPSLFMQFAPLSTGVLTNVITTTNLGCC